ncbi:MAG: amidohydrolase family protein, partial [Pseudomonadales bacterium]
EEAIEAYTYNPAWAAFEEAEKGRLTPGRLADLVVWDRNLVQVGQENPKALLDAKVWLTMVGGKVVYQAGAE